MPSAPPPLLALAEPYSVGSPPTRPNPGFVMFGSPGEKQADALKTSDFLQRHAACEVTGFFREVPTNRGGVLFRRPWSLPASRRMGPHRPGILGSTP